jgi:hypothetical protein
MVTRKKSLYIFSTDMNFFLNIFHPRLGKSMEKALMDKEVAPCL